MNPSETILILDDEPQLRMNLRVLLEDLGYRVIEAVSGPHAIEACAREHPDLVLLDIRMPGMDGFEVCGRLKADASLRAIPVIFLSGMLDAQDKVKAFQVGGVDYVTKPFHIEEVEARVRTHLEMVHQRIRLEEQNDQFQSSLRATEQLNRKLIEMNERLRQSEALKGQFLSIMRNEINNPLNSILAFAVELEEGKISPERCRAVGGMMATEASGLDFQIRNIFCAAELEAGEICPSITLVDVASVIRDVLDSLHYEAQRKNIRLVLEIPEPPCPSFHTDADKLRLIAANLVSNGIKFSPEGSSVHIRLQVQEEALRFDVEDEGIGIRPEDHSVIFERFRQLDTGASRGQQGQGLGLSVVKALVDFLDGSLTLSSHPGKGSLFSCSLPKGKNGDSATSSMNGNLFFFDDADQA